MSRASIRVLIFGVIVAAASAAGSGQAWAAWAAVAADHRGAWGYAVGQPDKATAERLARSGCGNRRCRVVGSAQAQCIAYWHFTGGGYWYGVGIGDGKTAMETAARGCGHPQRPCVAKELRCG